MKKTKKVWIVLWGENLSEICMSKQLAVLSVRWDKEMEHRKKVKAVEERQDRQYEMYQALEKRTVDNEKSREYSRGVRDGRAEIQGAKKE